MSYNFKRALWQDGKAITPDLLNLMSGRLYRMLAQLAVPHVGYVYEPGLASNPEFLGAGSPSSMPYEELAFQLLTGGRWSFTTVSADQPSGNMLIASRVRGGAFVGDPHEAGEVHASGDDVLLYRIDGNDIVATLPAAPGANPRIDSFYADLSWAEENLVAVDFEDAATRAVSTQNLEDDRVVALSTGFVQGAEAATPSRALLSSGRRRLWSKYRPVGDAAPYDPEHFYLEVMPPRLHVVDVLGKDMSVDIASAASFSKDSTGQGDIQCSGAGAGTIHAVPDFSPPGARLVGVGVWLDHADSLAVDIVRFAHGSSGRVPTTVVSGALSAGSPGFWFAGWQDWPTPVWGNGHPYGPAFDPSDFGAPYASSIDKVGISIRDDNPFQVADVILMARFFFAY